MRIIKKERRAFLKGLAGGLMKGAMGGGGGSDGGGNTVISPYQGPGITNSQVVVNSLGTPQAVPYWGQQVLKAYS